MVTLPEVWPDPRGSGSFFFEVCQRFQKKMCFFLGGGTCFFLDFGTVYYCSWWFRFNPFEKYARQIGSFPQVGMKIPKNMFQNHQLVYHSLGNLVQVCFLKNVWPPNHQTVASKYLMPVPWSSSRSPGGKQNPCLTLSMKSQMVNRDPYQNFFIFDVLICFVVYWIYNIDLQYLHLCPSGENVNIYNQPNPKLSSLKWWTGFSPFFHGRKWMGNWGYIPTYKAYNLQSHL